jgi:hypothetical protein
MLILLKPSFIREHAILFEIGKVGRSETYGVPSQWQVDRLEQVNLLAESGAFSVTVSASL